MPLVEGGGPVQIDRVQVDLVERVVPATMECPDGLEVQEWRLVPFTMSQSNTARIGAEREGSREEK